MVFIFTRTEHDDHAIIVVNNPRSYYTGLLGQEDKNVVSNL